MLKIYKWTLSYLKNYSFYVLMLLAIIVGATVIELCVPKFIQIFLDEIIPQGNMRLYFSLLGVLAIFVVILLILRMCQTMLQRNFQEKASRDLQIDVYRHMRTLGYAYYEQQAAGKTLALLNTETASVQRLYKQLFPVTAQTFIFSIISIILMVTSSWQLTLAFLPFFMLYYLFGPAVEQRAAVASKGLAAARIVTNQKAYESISALQELRAFSAEDWDLKRYMNTVKGWNSNLIRTYFYNYFRYSIRTATNYLGALALFILGVYLVLEKHMLAGEFIAFFLYYTAAINQMTRFIQTLADQKVVMHQAERVYEFLQTKPGVTEMANAIEFDHQARGELLFDNVSFGYEPDKLILKNFSLHIKPGQRVAIVGESGSGKSTLFKLIGRFYDPEAGKILLDGVPINSLTFETLRNSLGYVFQETYLFGHSITENIRFGRPEASEEEVIEAAKAASAHEFIQELPDGYNTHIGDRGNKLSGGQRQRIALARLVLKQPSILLLDEATSALDNRTEYEVQTALERLTEGRTVIAIAHRLSTIRNFDLIVVMESGRIIETGTYDQLIDAGGRFSMLAASDAKNEGVSISA